ncbi:MAG: hypothetical protein JWR83_631 [Aeromicrobium sp.]|nr:hypothetical protein [Aeromicrobium sp.]
MKTLIIATIAGNAGVAVMPFAGPTSGAVHLK